MYTKTPKISLFALTFVLVMTSACTERQSAQPEGTMADSTQMQTDTSSLGSQSATSQASLGLNQQGPYGQYLVDGEGMSLYLFKKDEQGAGSSACTDDCANAWPPLLTSDTPMTGSSALDSTLFGSIQRKDGSQQVTYNGWPLYYFSRDQQSGDTKGQDVEAFGAEWYLVTADGMEAHGEEGEGS